jgi:hypothetical protein
VQVKSVDKACSALVLSPIKAKNSPLKRRGCVVRNKVTQMCSRISCKLNVSFQIAVEPINLSEELKHIDEYQTLISNLQTKIKVLAASKKRSDHFVKVINFVDIRTSHVGTLKTPSRASSGWQMGNPNRYVGVIRISNKDPWTKREPSVWGFYNSWNTLSPGVIKIEDPCPR